MGTLEVIEITTIKDAESYFCKRFGHKSHLASRDQLSGQIAFLEKGGLFSDLLATALLHQYAGQVLLEQENPAAAQFFLSKTVQLFSELENSSSTSGKRSSKRKNKNDVPVKVMRMLAETVLARCWVRNYDKIKQARITIDEIIVIVQSHRTVQYAEVYINALLTKLEFLILHQKGEKKEKELAEICHVIHLPFSILFNKKHHLYNRFRIDFAALFCTITNYDPKLCRDSMQTLSDYDDQDEGYYIAKAVLRQGKPLVDLQILDAESFIFDRVGNHWNECALAHAYYIGGEHLLGKWFSMAAKNFEMSYELRKKHLGASHIDTARAHFEMARAMSCKADKSEDVDPEILKIMESALDVFAKCNEGLHTLNSDALQFYSELLCVCGRISEAAPHIEKCIANEIIIWNGSSIIPSLRRYEFGKLYEKSRMWVEATDVYELARQNLECEEVPINYLFHFVDVYCHLGFSYTKMGKYTKALENFNHCKKLHRQYGFDETSKHFIVLILQQAECLFLMNQIEASKKLFQEGLAIFQKDPLATTDEAWNSVHLQIAFYYEYVVKAFDSAKEYYEKVLKWEERRVHYRHPTICQLLLCLSRVALKQENLMLSESYAFKCLKVINNTSVDPLVKIFDQVLKKRFFKNSFKKEKTLILDYFERFSNTQISEVSLFVASLSFSFAKQLYKRETTSSEENDSVKETYVDMFEKCCQVFRKMCGPRSSKTAESERMLGLCYLKSGQLRLAEWYLFNSAVVLQLPQ